MELNFETYGKWILAGEHTVLRGGPAIVFPLLSKQVSFSYTSASHALQISIEGESAREVQLIFPGLLDAGLERIGKSRADLNGHLKIVSRLPLGTGLGASAAYCVGVSRLLVIHGWLKETDTYEFSRKLENLFHGESSGVDIAAALSGRPILFYRGQEPKPIVLKWFPDLYLSYSGERGVTSECVQKVSQLWVEDADLAKVIDLKMKHAVELCLSAFMLDPSDGERVLCDAMNMSRECFSQWELSAGALDTHMDWLLSQGAKAVKPTGSGGGGFVLSLWTKPPSIEAQKHLIKI